MHLKGKTIILTGGKRIGMTVARTLAKKGAKLVLTYNHSKKEAEQNVKEIEFAGGKAIAVKTDLTKVKDVASVINATLSNFGHLDGLVHMASTFKRTPFNELTEAEWNEQIENNLKTAYLCSKAAADVMLTSGGGKIIFITDWAIHRPYKNYLPYLVAKGGVYTLSLVLAKELAPTIQVNCVAPGPVLFPEDYSLEIKQREIKKTLLKREGSPQDVANAVLFLLENANFTTGSCVYVDGGKLLF